MISIVVMVAAIAAAVVVVVTVTTLTNPDALTSLRADLTSFLLHWLNALHLGAPRLHCFVAQ